MLKSAMYQTEGGSVYCDRCSLLVIQRNHSLSMSRVKDGRACTCDACKTIFRAA